MIRPLDEFQSLMDTLFRLERLVLMVLGLVSAGALAAAALVFALSFRLRRREFRTLEDIGVPRSSLLASRALEILLTGALGVVIAILLASLAAWRAGEWAALLLAGG
ncbi:MAG TPA: hypothetical protein DIT64_16080 [Verrucomicrobiales bacterium]|nr:hypothetical protein [Verrucomicrobiales bacterium]